MIHSLWICNFTLLRRELKQVKFLEARTVEKTSSRYAQTDQFKLRQLRIVNFRQTGKVEFVNGQMSDLLEGRMIFV